MNFNSFFNKWTLRFEDQELESEWLISEIASRKNVLYSCIVFLILIDILFKIMSNVTLIMVIIECSFDAICMLSAYMILHHKPAKNIQKILCENEEKGVVSDKWQNTLNKQII